MGPCLFTVHLLAFDQMTFQWLKEARRIGKRLATVDKPTDIQRNDETHEVICGIAGCVIKRKKLNRFSS